MKTFYHFFLLFVSFIFVFQNTVYATKDDQHFSLNSEAAILIDGATGTILYEKESNRLMYPASITKIVTGIIAIEEGNLDDIVTVSETARNVIGTRVYLLEGEQVTLLKLVQGLLINSGNDAGTAIAEYFDGSEAQFAERMNQFVRDTVGVKNTNFQNPHGLFDEKHQTTAYDMAIITQYAMKNPIFRSIVGTKEMEWIGKGWETTLYNHNKLLWRYEGTTGVKNGYVSQSGNTLVASVKRGNSEWIAVTLKADSSELAYGDMVKLFDYGFEHFQTNKITLNPSAFESYIDRFVIPEQLIFTSDKDEKFDIQIDDSAFLIVVLNFDGKKIYSKELEINNNKELKRDNTEDPSIEKKAASSPFSTSITFMFMLILTVVILILRKKRKQKKLSKQIFEN
ncbi:MULTISPECIES: D-alanyl-D-alanine carboxypeptidase family protein [Paenibacillus]|uniref:D-alanyl-D-alanine carboxypeptidase family protein n=1 Tax=Paenibacillus TaxID=44249 RepID=UPI001F42CCEF|nr:D-alanyl-D-alanine carboxypeptidase family protein [Paenibacillus sp. EPM92]